MTSTLTPYIDARHCITPDCIVVPNFVKRDECDEFINICENNSFDTIHEGIKSIKEIDKSPTPEKETKPKEVRQCDLKFVGYDRENKPVAKMFHRLFEMTEKINNTFFGFDLYGFNQVQYTLYNKKGSHYEWHKDQLQHFDNIMSAIPRKLSFSLVLSDKKEFNGSDFVFKGSSSSYDVKGDSFIPNSDAVVTQDKGTLLVFPSYILHKVTPLKSGVRKSLVWWATGPAFK